MNSRASDYRDVLGFEGLYTINEHGSFKAMPREITTGFKTTMLKQNLPQVTEHKGTRYAVLRNKEYKHIRVNVELMVKNIFGKPRQIFNSKHSIAKNARHKIKKPVNVNGCKGSPVEQIENGKVIAEFPTLGKAAAAVGLRASYISDAAYGINKYAAGFEWRFKKFNDNNK